MKEKFTEDIALMNKKLQGFQHLYQRHASGLLTMGSNVIPPGHPLYSKQNSMTTLKFENDKLVKENLELKKKMDKQNQTS